MAQHGGAFDTPPTLPPFGAPPQPPEIQPSKYSKKISPGMEQEQEQEHNTQAQQQEQQQQASQLELEGSPPPPPPSTRLSKLSPLGKLPSVPDQTQLELEKLPPVPKGKLPPVPKNI
jgi:hypothetical protein